ncbi:related to adenosine deaminase [Ustilago trichophora]|uniref:Related to adenosine deaminase n=1 Tax=Ustilago trichophora TaxID=86804 RepID=A0A5C3DS80_9BASI|nr:related to adenosine deaminase [Ustilago trichophora]
MERMQDPNGSDTTACEAQRQQRFVQQLPKIELHAHLNGSIRRSTLRELAAAKNVDPSNAFILTRWPKTLSEAFDVFRVIHSCVTTLADVERLAFELGQDLEEDGVVYAEIRTTPRAMDAAPHSDGSRYDGGDEEKSGLVRYVQAVLSGFSRYSNSTEARGSNKTVLRLLLSIDRAKHNTTQALAIVDLAHRYRHQGVLGIDLSGDPTKGNFLDFIPALQHARSLGLKITLHAGEVQGQDKEMTSMLKFHPDRMGHCCFVSPSNLDRLQKSGIPIELCLTSNLLSNSVTELKKHHFGLHYNHVESTHEVRDGENAGPTICCISTDDSGVFGSSLSNEYRLVMDNFNLSERQTFHLARRTLEATFLIRPTPDSSTTARQKAQRKYQQDYKRIHAAYRHFYDSWEWNKE